MTNSPQDLTNNDDREKFKDIEDTVNDINALAEKNLKDIEDRINHINAFAEKINVSERRYLRNTIVSYAMMSLIGFCSMSVIGNYMIYKTQRDIVVPHVLQSSEERRKTAQETLVDQLNFCTNNNLGKECLAKALENYNGTIKSIEESIAKNKEILEADRKNIWNPLNAFGIRF